MAISNLSSFKNMLPLDVLAAVASQEFTNEINSPTNPEIISLGSGRRQLKKSTTSVLTFQDIKSMPMKSLIDKFSEMTSDELTKKYFYRCMLLPETCTAVFKSFGNEKKACDRMKSHLQLHVQQLTKEAESSNGLSATIFVPKSPTSKHTDKLPKKSQKKQQMSLDDVLTHRKRQFASTSTKKTKNSTFSLKTVSKKVMENKYVSEVKVASNKTKERNVGSVYLKEYSTLKQFFEYGGKRKFFLSKREIPDDIDQDYDNYNYNSYSAHLKFTIFTDVDVKEESDESHSSFAQDDLNCSNSSLENISSSDIGAVNRSSDKSFEDHNYACKEGTKLFQDQSQIKSPKKYEDPFLQVSKLEQQWFIIKTPPFPYIHNPVLPQETEIVEIRMGDSISGVNAYSHYDNYWEVRPKIEIEEILANEYISDHEENYKDGISYKMSGPSGSVLECVENIENKKCSNSCVPKNEISASEDDENLENQQKNERELALKYIAKLHSKGKKKVSEPLVCQICTDKHFTAQATLIHHYRSHAGIKPYICSVCPSRFTRQHSLNYHMLIHQNLSRFTCDFCGRTFRHPSHYKEHLRRHTGETPYQCKYCNLNFKTRNTFKRHLKTRHGKLLTANGIADMNAE